MSPINVKRKTITKSDSMQEKKNHVCNKIEI